MSTPKQCVICHEFETKDRELTGSCDLPPDIHTMTDEEKKSVCRHVFHEECLDEWLKKKKTCPLCRDSNNNTNRNSSECDNDRARERRANAPPPPPPALLMNVRPGEEYLDQLWNPFGGPPQLLVDGSPWGGGGCAGGSVCNLSSRSSIWFTF